MMVNDFFGWAVLWMRGKPPSLSCALFKRKVDAINFEFEVGGEIYSVHPDGRLTR